MEIGENAVLIMKVKTEENVYDALTDLMKSEPGAAWEVGYLVVDNRGFVFENLKDWYDTPEDAVNDYLAMQM